MVMNIWEDWGPRSNHPPPRRGQNRQTYRSPKSNTNMKGSKGGGGGKKPPGNSGCGKKAAVFLISGSVAVAAIANAIGHSLG